MAWSLLHKTTPTSVWKASGDIEKQQRMANDPANRGSLFNVRHAVLYSLRRFLFIFPMFSIQCSLFNVRRAVRHSPHRSPFASSFATPFAIRRSPFASSFAAPFAIRRAVSYSFSLFKLRYSMFAAPLAIRSSPFANRRAIRRAIRYRFSMSPDAFHTSETT